MVDQGGHIVVWDCDLKGILTGVYIKGGELTATRLRVTAAGAGLGLMAYRLAGPACAELVDSELHSGQIGVIAVGREVQVTLRRGAVMGTGRPGTAGAVFGAGAAGLLNACEIGNVQSGVVVGDDDRESVGTPLEDGLLALDALVNDSGEGKTRRALPTGVVLQQATQIVAAVCANAVRGGENPGAERPVSQVTMMNVTVAGSVAKDVHVLDHGYVRYLEPTSFKCTVLDSEVGSKIAIEDTDENACSRPEDCRAINIACRTPPSHRAVDLCEEDCADRVEVSPGATAHES